MSNDKRVRPNEVTDDGYLHAVAHKIITTVLNEYRAGFNMYKVKHCRTLPIPQGIFWIEDRSEAACRKSRQLTKVTRVTTYQLVFPTETHKCVGKGSGQTNHMERWYGTLKQSCARFFRKTLSYSKSDIMHEIATRPLIIRHKLSLVT